MDLTGGTAKAGTWLWEPQAMRCVEENAGVLVGGVGSQGLPLLPSPPPPNQVSQHLALLPKTCASPTSLGCSGRFEGVANCSMMFWSQTMSLAHSPPPWCLASATLSLEDKLPLRAWSSEGFGLKGQVSSILTWLGVEGRLPEGQGESRRRSEDAALGYFCSRPQPPKDASVVEWGRGSEPVL